MTGRNPAYVTGEIKVSCCSKLGYRGNPGIKVNSNLTVPLARSWSCRSWHYSTVMGAPMDFCRKQYIHLHLFKLYVRTVQYIYLLLQCMHSPSSYDTEAFLLCRAFVLYKEKRRPFLNSALSGAHNPLRVSFLNQTCSTYYAHHYLIITWSGQELLLGHVFWPIDSGGPRTKTDWGHLLQKKP
jgi:hypothetical protein